MIKFFFLILPICFSLDFPETKPLRGGLFAWPNSLAPSRKMWKWLKIPTISFNFTDINLTQITEQYLINNLNFNINDEIRELLDELNTTNLDNYFIKNNNIKLSKSKTKCNPERYPNVNLVFNGYSEYFDCKTVEDTLGQIFSYLLMIMPLFVITIITLLFYFVFSFGRCFCFKPTTYIRPNLFEIISFSVVSFILLFSILYNFSGSFYFTSKVKYLLNEDIENDFTTSCQSFSPSIKPAIRNAVDHLEPIIDEIISTVTNHVNVSLPMLFNLINKTVEEASVYIDTFKPVENFVVKYNESLRNVEKSYQVCSSDVSSFDSSTCPKETLLLKNINFSGGFQAINDFKENVIYSVKVINVPDYIEEAHQDLFEIIGNMKEDAMNMMDPDNISFINNIDCNFNQQMLDVPSFVVPLLTIIFVLAPIIMLLTLAAQVYSFWIPGKFSRACSFMCVPCSFCMIFNFIIGSIGTIFSVIVIFYNIIYNDGDEVIDTVLKNVTNEDRIIHFGKVNLLSVTDDIVDTFYIDDIQIQKIKIMKKLMDAPVKSTLSDIISMDMLPIAEIAKTIESTMINLTSAIKFDKYILWDLIVDINKLIKSAPPSDLSGIVSIYFLKDKLDSFMNSVTCCGDEKTILYNEYNNFIDEFFNQSSMFSHNFQIFKTKAKRIPDEIANIATDFLIGLLKISAPLVATSVRNVSPILGSFDMSWAIGSFNLIRSKFLHPFLLGCIYLSISAHLYVISMTLMSFILWYRRRGMGDDKPYDSINSELIESGSGSVFTNLIT